MNQTGTPADGTPTGPTTLYLIRHGATEANERRPYILQGRSIDGPLSERGRAQAHAVADFLKTFRLDAVYSSELLRARQTAALIAGHFDLEPQAVAELGEVDVGRWEGKSWGEISREFPDDYAAFMNDCMNTPYLDGESYGDVLRRAMPALEAILDRHPGQRVAVVAHNVVNRVCLGSLLGLSAERTRTLKQSNCCVNMLEREPDGQTALVTLNSRFHLDDLA
jgi:broad specificity phosphatase PhoE